MGAGCFLEVGEPAGRADTLVRVQGVSPWVQEARGSARSPNANHWLDVTSSTELRARGGRGAGRKERWGEGESSDPAMLC